MFCAAATVANERGLHARPAMMLAKLAGAFDCEITIQKGKRKADAKSVTSLLMLVASVNSELTITANGKDEKEAVAAVLEMVASGFAEEQVVDNVGKLAPADKRVGRAISVKLVGVGGGGVVMGRARIYDRDDEAVDKFRLSKAQISAEVRRYERALARVREDLRGLRGRCDALPAGAEIARFVDVYIMLLQDGDFVEKPRAIIRRRGINAEWALKEHSDVVSDGFRQLQDDYLSERGRDLEFVVKRLLQAMAKKRRRGVSGSAKKRRAQPQRDMILVAHELDPADVISASQSGYKGFITEAGGATSHTAILARSMKMPALMGVRGVLACLKPNMPVLMDADAGAVYVNPDAAILKEYRGYRKPTPDAAVKRHKSAGGGIRDKGGESVYLHANIELPEECKFAVAQAADGIGLFRTEFLFMYRDDLPAEDEQFEIYRDVLSTMAPLPVVIRTLDAGADKVIAGAPDEKSVNPALGVRAIRYCLTHKDIFLTQLRALLRAHNECGNLKILFPMLSHPDEMQKTVRLLNTAAEQLRVLRDIPRSLPPLGGMIEVPASVFIMRALSKYLDFFSIGTNDLIQYMMALDRNNPTLNPLYDPLHPAILQILALIIKKAKRYHRPLMVCGEMAGEAKMTRLLLAMGIRHLSASPDKLASVRECVANSDSEKLRAVATQLLRAPTPAAAKKIQQKINTDLTDS